MQNSQREVAGRAMSRNRELGETTDLTRQMHEKISRLTNRIVERLPKQRGSWTNMTICFFEKEQLVNMWMEYMGELYDDDSATRAVIKDKSGPSITSTEVKHAIKKIKEQQSNWHRLDRSRDAEVLDDGPIEKLTQLCSEIYNTGYWPKDLKESIFIPIHKKPKATRCQEHRTISIMSQVSKLLLKIMMDRMKGKIEAELDDAQSGFRQGKGTREGLFNLRQICEKHLEVQKIVYICFVAYKNAFDRVRHESLKQFLSEIGVDGKT